MTREQTSYVQRLQKILEEANIKLDSVISDIVGVSGRCMIEALIAVRLTPFGWPIWLIGGSERPARHCVRRFTEG
jgi:hypothetical protein